MEIIVYILIGVLIILLGNYLRIKIRNKIKRNIRLVNHHQYLLKVKNMFKGGDVSDKPNVIIILTDDMGYGDISCYGASTIKTPFIDKLANGGVTFENFYASSSLCSPSRAGLLTGRYPVRMFIHPVFFPKGSFYDCFFSLYGAYKYGVKGILPDEITMAEALQQAGYATGLLGKWHLGDHGTYVPNKKGFDFFYGSYYSNDMKPYVMYRNTKIDIPAPVDQTKLTQILTREGINFIRENKNRPFFLHYCQPFPHHPVHASEKFQKSSKGGTYGDCVQELDWSIGELVKTLEQEGIREKTLILFTSDNGPWYEGNPGYVRGRKSLTFEGGQRVPMIANWPGKFPAGTKINEMSMNIDIFPTVLHLAGIPLPSDRVIDGKCILPLLTGETEKTPHDYLFYMWDYKVYAVRDSLWKYHIRHESDIPLYSVLKVGPYLFNIIEDFNESYNQIPHHPEEAGRLRKRIEAFEEELKSNPRGWTKQ